MLKRTAANPIKCRFAQKQDVDFIYECLLNLFDEEGNIYKFSQTKATLFDALFSDKPFAECIIAEMDRVTVGILLFSVTNHNFTAFTTPGAYVHDIYVLDEYRRKGIARELGNYLKAIAEQRNYSRIDGIILKNNQNALAFYQNVQDISVLDYIYYMRLNLK